MASETETLRVAIETALRRRDPEAIVSAIDAAYEGLAMTGVIVVGVRMRAVAPATADALRALALACGLRVETCGACNGRGRHAYAREIEDGCDACECAGVVVVDPAAEVERLTQEVATLTRERDEARAALTHFAPRCAHGAIATWSARIDEAPTKCDACRRDTSVEHEHAAALRAAGGGR